MKIVFTEEDLSLLDQCIDLSISDVSNSVLKAPQEQRGFLKEGRNKLINLQQKIKNHDKDK